MQLSEKKWEDIKNEATSLLREYIRINTTNPPGNEIEGANLLTPLYFYFPTLM